MRILDECRETLRWFAVRVKSNQENVLASSLSRSGYEILLPKYSPAALRKGHALRPLFPGYVFCRFDINRRLPILMLPAVVYIVGIGKTPAPIEEEEIASLRVAAHSGLPMIPIEYLPGERVRIEAGPLAGVTGIVAGRRNDRIVVSITLLQRSIAVNLPPEWLSSLRSVA